MFSLLAIQSTKDFSFMDWVSSNLIDFTLNRLSLMIDIHWGFVVALAAIAFFLILARLRRPRKPS